MAHTPPSPATADLPDAAARERLTRAIGAETTIEEALRVVEEVYADAAGDPARIPWSHARANPALVAWLNARASGLIRCGARVAVVGCGLGHDAAALAERGYDVTAFDASAAAVEAAQRLHPTLAGNVHVADLRNLPSRWRHRFDLAVEIHTLQALPPRYREELAAGVAELIAPHGRVLAIARGREADEPLDEVKGPPFPFTREEFEGVFRAVGLTPQRAVDAFQDGNRPPVLRLRGCFLRAEG
jgi:SAM-dependent methyltransferase